MESWLTDVFVTGESRLPCDEYKAESTRLVCKHTCWRQVLYGCDVHSNDPLKPPLTVELRKIEFVLLQQIARLKRITENPKNRDEFPVSRFIPIAIQNFSPVLADLL